MRITWSVLTCAEDFAEVSAEIRNSIAMIFDGFIEKCDIKRIFNHKNNRNVLIV